MVTVRVTLPNGHHELRTFASRALIIGRDPDADIVLTSPHVSLRHARVRWRGARIIITDLRSQSGTFARGRRLTSPTVLDPGEPVEIGDVCVSFSAPHLPHELPFPHPPEAARDIKRVKAAVLEHGESDRAATLYTLARRHNDDDAALVAMQHASPSPDTWQAWTEHLEGLSGASLESALSRAESALERWPDRLCVAPPRWWGALTQDHQTPLFRIVRVLTLHGELAPHEIDALVHAPGLAAVRVLSLSGLAPVPSDLWVDILRNPHLGELTSLDLSHHPLDTSALGALLETPSLARGTLRHLALNGCALGGERLRFLVRAPQLSSLSVLELRHNGLGSDAARALSGASALRGLQRIELGGNDWTPENRFRLKTRSVFGAGVVHLEESPS